MIDKTQDKTQNKINFKETQLALMLQIYKLRIESKISISKFADNLNIPVSRVMKLDIKNIHNLRLSELQHIANCYNKKLKITFEE